MYRRPELPQGHGEVLALPPYDQWERLADENAARAGEWEFTVGDMPVGELRAHARQEALAAAASFSERLGVPVRADESPERIIVSGHQPELYHTGVWVKAFLLQRIAEEQRARGRSVAAIDVVVDSDSYDAIAVTSPCWDPGITRCRAYLAVGRQDGCYACTPTPSSSEIAQFRETVLHNLSTLPAPAIGRHFGEFCDTLAAAAPDARNVSELLTLARRRYEAPAGTDYLELPVTLHARSSSFLRFVAHLALDARRFRECYNESLQAFRRSTGTRSSVQPFPDLEEGDGATELPFWLLDGDARRPLHVRGEGVGIELFADGFSLALPASPDRAVATLAEMAPIVAPRAATLTMFQRLFVADLFIHGVGGARYDAVTDEIVRRYFGIEPPRFTVASMTMYLPIGAHVITEQEVEIAEARLKRLEHNPDQLLGEVDFESPGERERARQLAEEKSRLVREIALPNADKKSLGGRIREVNAELAAVMEPLAEALRREIESLRAQRHASDILTDRSYPYCFWNPFEIADKVR